MQVFLSWSGARSKAVAQALNQWLMQVIQAVDPWMSSEIGKGARWSPEIAAKLEGSRIGIICLTKENLSEPWILFEAGALSKTKDAQVCTFLLDLQPADVVQPLGQFQHTTIDKADVRKLVGDINAAVGKNGEKALADQVLDEIFKRSWPALEAELQKIAHQGTAVRAAQRTEREILEEILEISRSQERRSSESNERNRLALAAALRSWSTPRGPERGALAALASDHRLASNGQTLADYLRMSGTSSVTGPFGALANDDRSTEFGMNISDLLRSTESGTPGATNPSSGQVLNKQEPPKK